MRQGHAPSLGKRMMPSEPSSHGRIPSPQSPPPRPPPPRPALRLPHWLLSGLRWQAEKERMLCQDWALDPLASAQLPPRHGFLEAWPPLLMTRRTDHMTVKSLSSRIRHPWSDPGLPPAGSMALGTVPLNSVPSPVQKGWASTHPWVLRVGKEWGVQSTGPRASTQGAFPGAALFCEVSPASCHVELSCVRPLLCAGSWHHWSSPRELLLMPR